MVNGQCPTPARLTPYLAEGGGTGTAVIVCPGGSYSWHDMGAEGREVAEWLGRNGISAFVLKYRVQGIVPYITHSRLLFRGNQHPDALNDLRCALEHLCLHAEEYGIDPRKIGVMGFSAGGHLALSAIYNKEIKDLENKKGVAGEAFPASPPAFVAAIYPVVSLSHPCSHKRSRRALLGEYRKYRKAMRDSLSIEKHIPKDCPPVFLVNCKDDPIVKCHNSELLDSALTAQGVAHRYIQYETGGHGFGASETKGSAECRAWKEEFLRWILTIDR